MDPWHALKLTHIRFCMFWVQQKSWGLLSFWGLVQHFESLGHALKLFCNGIVHELQYRYELTRFQYSFQVSHTDLRISRTTTTILTAKFAATKKSRIFVFLSCFHSNKLFEGLYLRYNRHLSLKDYPLMIRFRVALWRPLSLIRVTFA